MKVLVSDVLKIAPVLKEVPWGVSVDSECFYALVNVKVESGEFCAMPFEDYQRSVDFQGTWDEYHAQRVSYFVLNRWHEPISIDVGIPGICDVRWPVTDGNHRLYAAAFGDDEFIEAELQGSVSELEEIFGLGCCE